MGSRVFSISVLFQLVAVVVLFNDKKDSLKGDIEICAKLKPQVEQTLSVQFRLVTRETIDVPNISRLTDVKLFNGSYNPQLRTIFLIHGYNESLQTSVFSNKTTTEYLSAYDGAVIITYWEAAMKNYTEARCSVGAVATNVASFLDRMVLEESLNLTSLTVVGFGMGAHVGGTAGRLVQGRIKTMTGLDAVNMQFIPKTGDTIDEKSADFVQVIQTSVTAEGIFQPLGHATFYPNGGFPPQPGCENFPDYTWTTCSDQRSYELYTETFKNPCAFPATQCGSNEAYQNGACNGNYQAYMGHATKRNARGTFFLRTRSSSPFGIGNSENPKNDQNLKMRKSKKMSAGVKQKKIRSKDMKSSEENRVHFYLFTRSDPDKPIISNVNDSKLFDGAYDGSKPTVVLISGYLMAANNSTFSDLLVETYLSKCDVSVISIFWDVALEDYRISSAKTKDVAIVVAQFLDRMMTEENLDMQKLTVIGHSSGAQIGGTAGRLTKKKIATVVGLDPARPLFYPGGDNVINRNSADFVQIIHVGGTVLGIFQPLGHVDFYVNGGLPPQPGCEGVDTIYPITPFSATCSHLERVVELYAESITNPKAFSAVCLQGNTRCKKVPIAYMGQNTSRSARGTYYLKTEASSPYGLG